MLRDFDRSPSRIIIVSGSQVTPRHKCDDDDDGGGGGGGGGTGDARTLTLQHS